MKKLFLFSLLLFGLNASLMAEMPDRVCIADYKPSYLDDVKNIVFKDIELIFGIKWTEEDIKDFKSSFEADLIEEDESINKVLVEGDNVIGFARYLVTSEGIIPLPPLEELCPGCSPEQQAEKAQAYMKQKEAEAPKYIDLDILVIARDYRSQGLGKMFIEYIENDIRDRWPDIKLLKFAVDRDNIRAQNFYKNLGFVQSAEQPYDKIRYEKKL